MAMADFLRNVQTARNVFLSQLVALDRSEPVVADRSPEDWRRLRTTAPVWLSPSVVASFDPDEYGFLATDQQRVLSEAVAKFRAIAEAAAGREPTPEEMNQAIWYLVVIAGVLEDNLLDEEGGALLAALVAAKKPFPDFVLGLDYTLDTDATGDPGVWVWVLVPDDIDPDSKEFRQFANRFPQAVRNALAEIKSNRLPYIHYRPLSEVVDLMSEGVA